MFILKFISSSAGLEILRDDMEDMSVDFFIETERLKFLKSFGSISSDAKSKNLFIFEISSS